MARLMRTHSGSSESKRISLSADLMNLTAALMPRSPSVAVINNIDVAVTDDAEALRDAKTVVWNGPMGVFEMDAFAKGTIAVGQAVAGVTGTTIVGGGDSISAVTKAGVASRITHISTGGGASLEFLGGRTLPGVAALPAGPNA